MAASATRLEPNTDVPVEWELETAALTQSYRPLRLVVGVVSIPCVPLHLDAQYLALAVPAQLNRAAPVQPRKGESSISWAFPVSVSTPKSAQ